MHLSISIRGTVVFKVIFMLYFVIFYFLKAVYHVVKEIVLINFGDTKF